MRIVVLILLSLTFALDARADRKVVASKKAPDRSFATGACLAEERWEFSERIPLAWREKFARIPASRDEALDVYAWAYVLGAAQKNSKDQEAAAVADYWMARMLHQMGLHHLSDRGFSRLVKLSPSPMTAAVSLAALQCLNQTRNHYPSLEVSPDAVEGVKNLTQKFKLTSDQVLLVRDFIARYARRNLGRLSWEPLLLKGSGPYESLVLAMDAAAQEDDEGVVTHGRKFLANVHLVGSLKSLEDPIRLMVGRSLFHLGNWKEAVDVYGSVNKTSNYFAESLQESAWSYVNANQHEKAASSAYNLMVGGVRRSFTPEAPLVMAMAQFETCHFPEALKSIRFFRKNYVQSYRWLYNWKAGKPMGAQDLYQAAVGHLGKTVKVPDRVGSEWLRSPIFISAQQEINLLLDEKMLLESVVPQLRRMDAQLSKNRRRQQAYRELRKNMFSFYKAIPALQKRLVARINQDLGARNEEMMTQLVEMLETSQLLEVEIYDAAGEDMIIEYVTQDDKKMAQERAKKSEPGKDKGGPAVLDWGRFPAGDDEKAEIWLDELGALKTDLNNLCKSE